VRRFLSLAALLGASVIPLAAGAVQAPRRVVTKSLTSVTPDSQSGAVVEVPGIAPLRREVDVRYGAAPRALRQAFATFVADTGQAGWTALWDTATRRPVRLYGGFVPAPGTAKDPLAAEKHARDFLARHAALLLANNSIADFDLVVNDDDAGLRTIGFQQMASAGALRVPVLGGRVNLRYKADRLFLLGGEALPAGVFVSPATSPAAAHAAALAHLTPAQPGATASGATLVALPLVRKGGVRLVLAWQVATGSAAPASRTDVFIDARDATVIATQENLHFLSGSIKYEAPVRGPGEHSLFPAASAHLLIDDASYSTDKTGQFSTTDPASTLACFARSNVIDVLNSGGDAASLELAPVDGADVVWSLKDDEEGDAQLSAFVHASIAKEVARKIAPGMTFLNQSLKVKVNQDDPSYACNAYWNGFDLNFFLSSQQCNNTARVADVVYHEFGHAFHTHTILASVGGYDPALAEGGADYFASIITSDPHLAPGFFTNGGYLREFDTDYRWPEDISWDPHETGLIFAGAMWDLRTILSKEMGEEEGAALAHQLYRGALKRAPNIPATFAEVLATDDDDGDLGNGTPHTCQILQAFAPHGITPYLTASGLTLVHDPVKNLPAQTEPYDVRVGLAHAFPQCAVPGDDVDGLEIQWHTQGMSGKAVMTKDGDDYLGQIPGLVAGTQLEYKLVAKVGNAQSFLPQNAADPEYRAFVGDLTPVYCADFEEGADDWTFGEDNGKSTDFGWGEPHGAAGDPATAFGGQHVIGTNLSVEGHYRSKRRSFATGPVVDLSEHKHLRLQLMRWLTVEDGYFDQATVLVNGQQVWTNKGTDEQDGSLTHADLEWRFEDIDISAFATSANKSAQVRFELTSDEYGEYGGWNIDDVCIMAWEPPPGSGAGGSGGSGGGESGGSGGDGTGIGPDDPGCACRTGAPTNDGNAPWALFGAAAALGLLVRRRK